MFKKFKAFDKNFDLSKTLFYTIGQYNHLIAGANRTVIEAEEVYELIQELAHTDGGGVHRAAQSLKEGRTHQKDPQILLSCLEEQPLTQKKSSFMRMANLQRRSLRVLTREEDSSDTQRPTPAS